MKVVKLPMQEFEVLRYDNEEIHLYDKVVDKIYVWTSDTKKWQFPAGSRLDVVYKLAGVDLR